MYFASALSVLVRQERLWHGASDSRSSVSHAVVLVIGHWSLVIGHWSFVSGLRASSRVGHMRCDDFEHEHEHRRYAAEHEHEAEPIP